MKKPGAIAFSIWVCTSLAALGQTVRVDDDTALREAIRSAAPGTRIEIAPGGYRSGIMITGLHGTADAPIVIGGRRGAPLPRIEGGTAGLHLVNCSHVEIQNLHVKDQRSNGINIDDGGDYSTPSHHIVLDGVVVEGIGPTGNHDGIKLSGVDDFQLRRCVVQGWGGQAIDMVGCHRGRITQCRIEAEQGYTNTSGVQTKGGSRAIVVQQCQFLGPMQRAVNAGGSTGRAYYRPLDALYEAKDITVEHCAFFESNAPVAFVGVDGALFQHNTIVRPTTWVLRILQETRDEGFITCRDGVFRRNIVVFRRDEIRSVVNIGSHTSPETFIFEENLWYCADAPGASRPDLPTPERGGIYGVDPGITWKPAEFPFDEVFFAEAAAAQEYGANLPSPP